MKLPTDTDLEKRAQEITENIFLGHDFRSTGRINDIKWMEGHESATLEALRIDRESLRLLRHARHDAVTSFAYWKEHGYKEMADESKERVGEIDAHLTTLRTRLGITE